MKNSLILLYLLFIFSSCNKDDNPFMGKDQLPPETQTGANTAGCLINGQVFLPSQEGLNPSLVCNYEYLQGKFYFNLTIRDNRGMGIKTISIQTRQVSLEKGRTYILNRNIVNDGDFIGGAGRYGLNANIYYYTNNIKVGEVIITELNLQNSLISGTFWFDAINSNGESVEVREGRFDMKY